MELKKSRILNGETLVDFVCYRAKVNHVELTPERLNSVLRAHFKVVLDEIIENGVYEKNSLKIRLIKKETVLISKKERQYWVLPNFGSAYSYSLRVTFKDTISSNYYLRPCREMLARLEKIVNSTPDLKLRFYVKKTA